MRTAIWLTIGCLVAGGCGRQERSAVPPADLVLLRGNLVTVDAGAPRAAALAARGGRIVALGADGDVRPLIGPGTRVIDLAGATAVPGLIEGHGHYLSLGGTLLELDLRSAPDFDAIVALAAGRAAELPLGEWVVGRGWHQDKWAVAPEPAVEGLPLHERLTAATPDHPVLLVHASGHGVFVNRLAFERGGYADDSPDPAGGEIVRGPDGRPTGMLREAAQDPVRAALARHRAQRPAGVIAAEQRRKVLAAGRNALENGITTFHDLGASFDELDLFREMAARGELPVRLYAMVDLPVAEMAPRLAGYRTVGFGDGFLTIRGIGEKVLDGALGTHGGWLLEPYADLPRSTGLVVNPLDELRAAAELAVAHDYQMAIQGIGDRAARELMDLYTAATAGRADLAARRWRIEHPQVVHPADLPRFAELGIIPAAQGVFACSDGPWVTDRLGPARTAERGYKFKTMVDQGAVATNGSDPPVEDISPIASFHCSVTRLLPDGTVFDPAERMSRELALWSYTMGNAYAAFEEDVKGSLTVGKYADVTVLSQDLLTVPDDTILDTRVLYTIVGGEVRYEASDGDSPTSPARQSPTEVRTIRPPSTAASASP